MLAPTYERFRTKVHPEKPHYQITKKKLTRVGVRDFSGLIGIEPNLSFAAAEDGGSKAFLGAQIDPNHSITY